MNATQLNDQMNDAYEAQAAGQPTTVEMNAARIQWEQEFKAAMTTQIAIGDVVKRAGNHAGTAYDREIGDVVEMNGDRCQVAWRSYQRENSYDATRPPVTVKGKRTWVRQSGLTKVA